MKILRLVLLLIFVCTSAEALSPRYRKTLLSGTFANKENFDRYIIAQQPTLFIDPDRIQTVTETGGSVSAIASRVGTYTFTQGAPANAPTLISQSSSLSGRRALRFDGTNDSMSSTATSANIFGASAKTGFVVFKTTRVSTTDDLFTDTSSYWVFYIPAGANNITWSNYDGAGDVASNGIVINKTYATNFYHDGINIAVRTNNEAYGSAASGATTVTTGTLWLGQDGLSAKYFSGDMGPVITFNRVLPKSVMDIIQQGLRKFYRTV